MRSLIALLTFVASATAFAGSLRNSDSHEYRVVVKALGKDDKSLPVNTMTYYEKTTCEAYPCTLVNKDSGEKAILTTKDENVEIKGGKFTIKL